MGDTKATAENGTEQRAKELIAQWMLGGPSLEGLEAKVAAALAACAREARLDEAKWWADGMHAAGGWASKGCEFCKRFEALERAVGEKG